MRERGFRLFQNRRGFTLMEVLVSAVVVSIAIFAVISVVRKGADLDISDLHRRQARALVNGLLEGPTLNPYAYQTLAFGATTTTDTLDNRSGANPLTCQLTTSISAETVVQGVPVKQIVVVAKWQESTYQDSIKIEKWITQAF